MDTMLWWILVVCSAMIFQLAGPAIKLFRTIWYDWNRCSPALLFNLLMASLLCITGSYYNAINLYEHIEIHAVYAKDCEMVAIVGTVTFCFAFLLFCVWGVKTQRQRVSQSELIEVIVDEQLNYSIQETVQENPRCSPSTEEVENGDRRQSPVMQEAEECNSLHSVSRLSTTTKKFYNDTSDSDSDSQPGDDGKIGMAIIVNVMNFVPHLNIEPRYGSDKDEEKIKKTFDSLKYKVEIIRNKDATDIEKELRRCAYTVSTNKCIKSVAVFVLSHGLNGSIQGADGVELSMSLILDIFCAKHHANLRGKPRLFAFQACLGNNDQGFDADKLEQVVQFAYDNVSQKEVVPNQDHSMADPTSVFIDTHTGEYSIPAPKESDFIVAYATLPGCTAVRFVNGSPFISFFMEEIENDHKNGNPERKNITDMLNDVNSRMISEHDRSICFDSSVSKALSFRPKVY